MMGENIAPIELTKNSKLTCVVAFVGYFLNQVLQTVFEVQPPCSPDLIPLHFYL